MYVAAPVNDDAADPAPVREGLPAALRTATWLSPSWISGRVDWAAALNVALAGQVIERRWVSLSPRIRGSSDWRSDRPR